MLWYVPCSMYYVLCTMYRARNDQQTTLSKQHHHHHAMERGRRLATSQTTRPQQPDGVAMKKTSVRREGMGPETDETDHALRASALTFLQHEARGGLFARLGCLTGRHRDIKTNYAICSRGTDGSKWSTSSGHEKRVFQQPKPPEPPESRAR